MNTPKKQKATGFEIFIQVMGWLRIVASPLLIGAVIGLFIYLPDPGSERLVIAILITLFGLIIGIIWATNVWKKKGTTEYLSRIDASPEFDDIEKKD